MFLFYRKKLRFQNFLAFYRKIQSLVSELKIFLVELNPGHLQGAILVEIQGKKCNSKFNSNPESTFTFFYFLHWKFKQAKYKSGLF